MPIIAVPFFELVVKAHSRITRWPSLTSGATRSPESITTRLGVTDLNRNPLDEVAGIVCVAGNSERLGKPRVDEGVPHWTVPTVSERPGTLAWHFR